MITLAVAVLAVPGLFLDIVEDIQHTVIGEDIVLVEWMHLGEIYLEQEGKRFIIFVQRPSKALGEKRSPTYL